MVRAPTAAEAPVDVRPGPRRRSGDADSRPVTRGMREHQEPWECAGRLARSRWWDLVSFPGRRVCRADVRASLDEGRHGCLTSCPYCRLQILTPCLSTS